MVDCLTSGKLGGIGQDGDGGEQGGRGAHEASAQLKAAAPRAVHVDAGRRAVVQTQCCQVALLRRPCHPIVRVAGRRRQPARSASFGKCTT